MLDRISPRQKARGVLAVLSVSKDEESSLNELVSSLFGSPIAGAVTGMDFRTAEEVLEAFFDSEVSLDDELLCVARDKLDSPKVRRACAKAAVGVLNSLSEDHQKHAVAILLRVSEMDVPDFQQNFDNVEHFLSEGLFKFVAHKKTEDPTIFVCPHCTEVTTY
jgi:hypothetical protein